MHESRGGSLKIRHLVGDRCIRIKHISEIVNEREECEFQNYLLDCPEPN
jgi:hypothetical protein